MRRRSAPPFAADRPAVIEVMSDPDGRRAAFLGAWVAGANLRGGGLIMLRRLIVCAALSVAPPLYGSMAARIRRRSEVLRGDRSRARTLLYILFGYTNVEPSSAG